MLLVPMLVAACRCGNGDSASDADIGADVDGAPDDAGIEEAADDDARDADDTEVTEDAEAVIETRDGATAGVVCRKVPSPGVDARIEHDGEHGRVVFAPALEGFRDPLVLLDWSDGSQLTLDDLLDLPVVDGMARLAESPSLEYLS